jgi:hypothetical protein
MADEIDLANEQAEHFLKQSLANLASAPKLPPRGNCYNCDTEFAADDPNIGIKLFCDKDCADDYTYRDKLQNRR